MRAVEKLRVGLMAAGMCVVGVLHFANPAPFVAIVPAALPAPEALVFVSGVAEVAGGVGLLLPATRRGAALGLIALFVAVFPANVNMAVNGIQPTPGVVVPAWAAWARLPLQAVLIAWAWSIFRSAGVVADRASEAPPR